MFLIGRLEAEWNFYERFDKRNWFSEFGNLPYHSHFEKIEHLEIYEQYVNCLYWAYATLGTVAYGDIIPVAPCEKIYGIIWMILSKVFTAFIYAEAANVVSSVH